MKKVIFNRRTAWLVAVFTIGTIIFFSCKKERNAKSENPTLIEMKAWIKSNLKDSITIPSDTALFSNIVWQTAHEVSTSDVNYDIAIITNSDTIKYYNPEKGIVRLLVITKKNGKLISGRQFQLYGNLAKINKNLDKYISGYSNPMYNSDYSGIITIKSLSGNFVGSHFYIFGLETLQSDITANASANTIQSLGNKKTNGCTDYYLVYRDEYGTEVYREFMFENCDANGCAQESISSTGVQSIKLACGGSGGGTPPATAISTTGTVTTDGVINACLKNMVKFAITDDVQFNAKETVNSVFGSSVVFNLHISDGNIQDPTTMGETTIMSRVPVLVGPGVTVTDLETNIVLNSNVLPNASREFIASTIIHECFHAYLELSTPNSQQHELMAQNYIPAMTAALLKMFPSMDPSEANSLSWGGLQADAADLWNKLTPAQQTKINADNIAYEKGNKGHQCSGT